MFYTLYQINCYFWRLLNKILNTSVHTCNLLVQVNGYSPSCHQDVHVFIFYVETNPRFLRKKFLDLLHIMDLIGGNLI